MYLEGRDVCPKLQNVFPRRISHAPQNICLFFDFFSLNFFSVDPAQNFARIHLLPSFTKRFFHAAAFGATDFVLILSLPQPKPCRNFHRIFRIARKARTIFPDHRRNDLLAALPLPALRDGARGHARGSVHFLSLIPSPVSGIIERTVLHRRDTNFVRFASDQNWKCVLSRCDGVDVEAFSPRREKF